MVSAHDFVLELIKLVFEFEYLVLIQAQAQLESSITEF